MHSRLDEMIARTDFGLRVSKRLKDRLACFLLWDLEAVRIYLSPSPTSGSSGSVLAVSFTPGLCSHTTHDHSKGSNRRRNEDTSCVAREFGTNGGWKDYKAGTLTCYYLCFSAHISILASSSVCRISFNRLGSLRNQCQSDTHWFLSDPVQSETHLADNLKASALTSGYYRKRVARVAVRSSY